VKHILAILLLTFSLGAQPAPKVDVMRVPEGGIQPQVAVDERGVVHLLYYKGHEAKGDLFYTKWEGEAGFAKPIRVNSQEGSAIAIGTIRGGHIAVGKNGRVHVAWMGSSQAEPKAGGKATPMLYARMNEERTGFESQKNVIQEKVGLDGGGSVAADTDGNVYVAWHAPTTPKGDEQDRKVWVARSRDEGKTFAKELAAWDEPTGVCGCCGMRIVVERPGSMYILYRAAKEMVHRDMYLLTGGRGATGFVGRKVGEWEIAKCVMSTASFARSPGGALAAWESQDQVYWAMVGGKGLAPPGKGNRKHPVVAVNKAGQTILAWAEGTGWNKGGSVAWQVFDAISKPMDNGAGKADGLPTWSMPAVFAKGDGFVIIY
jgi:hypothetical protein